MKKIFTVLLFLLVAFAACAQPPDVDVVYSGMIPQIVVWDAVTTDINGVPILPDDVISYNIYYALAPGIDDKVFLANVTFPEGTVDFSSLHRGYYYVGVSTTGETAGGAIEESSIAWSSDPVAVGPTSRFAYLVTGDLLPAVPKNLQPVGP